MKLLFRSLPCLWLLSTWVYAQQPVPPLPAEDSLLRVCSAMPDDTAKVICFNSLARTLLRNNPTKAQDIADRALSLSEDLAYSRGQCRALNTIGAANQALGALSEAYSSINQAMSIANKTGDISGKANSLHLLGGILREQQDSTAIGFMLQALALHQQLNDSIGMATSLNSIGAFYGDRSQYQQSLENYLRAADLCRKMKKDLMLSIIYNNASSQFDESGQPDSADHYFQQAIEIKQRLNDPKGTAYAYHSQALRMQRRGDDQQSLVYALKALEIFRKITNVPSAASCLMAIGTSYLNLKNYTKALEAFQEALALYQDIDNQISTISAFAFLGKVYEAKGDLPNAIDMYSKSLVLANSIEEGPAIALAAEGLGRTFVASRQYVQAISSLSQCTSLIKAGKVSESAHYTAYYQLYLAYRGAGNESAAEDMRTTYNRLKERYEEAR